jgi:hypothetical protein
VRELKRETGKLVTTEMLRVDDKNKNIWVYAQINTGDYLMDVLILIT